MPKGKKFNAAEKHFKMKEEDYRYKIKKLENIISHLHMDTQRLTDENRSLAAENNALKEWIDRLLTYTELSKGDIKAACEQDKKRDEALVSLSGLLKIFGG